jgi:hypothetical protein
MIGLVSPWATNHDEGEEIFIAGIKIFWFEEGICPELGKIIKAYWQLLARV